MSSRSSTRTRTRTDAPTRTEKSARLQSEPAESRTYAENETPIDKMGFPTVSAALSGSTTSKLRNLPVGNIREKSGEMGTVGRPLLAELAVRSFRWGLRGLPAVNFHQRGVSGGVG